MSLRSKFKMSKVLETNGVQYEISNARITLARAGGGNIRYTAAMEKLARDHGRAITLDLMSNERGTQLMREVYADCIVLNWETKADGADNYAVGIEDIRDSAAADAPLLPFNRESIIQTFKEAPDLLVELKQMAENMTLYRQSNLEAVAGN